MYQDVIEFHEKDGVNIFIATFMGISYLTHGVWNNSEEVVKLNKLVNKLVGE